MGLTSESQGTNTGIDNLFLMVKLLCEVEGVDVSGVTSENMYQTHSLDPTSEMSSELEAALEVADDS